MDNEKRWYVIHTYSGYENKVKVNLEKKIKSLGLEKKIICILVPTEEKIEYRGTTRKAARRKIFPGYVLIEMIVNDQTWYAVRNTPGVTGFVGSGNKPIPLSDEELGNLLRVMGLDEKEKVKLDLEIGQIIEIIDGIFAGIQTPIIEIMHNTKVKVIISMFGRETLVELEYTQIKKVS